MLGQLLKVNQNVNSEEAQCVAAASADSYPVSAAVFSYLCLFTVITAIITIYQNRSRCQMLNTHTMAAPDRDETCVYIYSVCTDLIPHNYTCKRCSLRFEMNITCSERCINLQYLHDKSLLDDFRCDWIKELSNTGSLHKHTSVNTQLCMIMLVTPLIIQDQNTNLFGN